MFRKLMFLAILTIMLLGTMSMAATSEDAVLTPDEIIIAEPITENVFTGKSVYVTVNILDASYYEMLSEQPLMIQVVKFEDTLPFADELGDALNVPVVKLSSSAAMAWLASEGSGDDVNWIVQSETYAEETEIINQYFSQLDRINAINLKISAAKQKYQFDTVMRDETNITLEIENAYNAYLSDLNELTEMERAFKDIQSQYLKLFEVAYLDDLISTPSYSTDIGTLDEGSYRIRIYDNDGDVIKAFSFKVTPQSDNIETILTEPHYSRGTN